MPTLLERALDGPIYKRVYTDEELDLVRAWMDDRIGVAQIMRVLKVSHSGAYVFLALGMRECQRRGKPDASHQ